MTRLAQKTFEIAGVGAKLDVAGIAFCSGASSVLTGVGDRFAGRVEPVGPGAPSILSDRVELAGASNEVDGFRNKAAGGVVEPAYTSSKVNCFSSKVAGGAELVAPGTPTTPLDEEELVLLREVAGTVLSELIEETNEQLCLLTFETGAACVTLCVSRARLRPLCPGRLTQRPCLPGTQSPHDLSFLQQEQFLHVPE